MLLRLPIRGADAGLEETLLEKIYARAEYSRAGRARKGGWCTLSFGAESFGNAEADSD